MANCCCKPNFCACLRTKLAVRPCGLHPTKFQVSLHLRRLDWFGICLNGDPQAPPAGWRDVMANWLNGAAFIACMKPGQVDNTCCQCFLQADSQADASHPDPLLDIWTRYATYMVPYWRTVSGDPTYGARMSLNFSSHGSSFDNPPGLCPQINGVCWYFNCRGQGPKSGSSQPNLVITEELNYTHPAGETFRSLVPVTGPQSRPGSPTSEVCPNPDPPDYECVSNQFKWWDYAPLELKRFNCNPFFLTYRARFLRFGNYSFSEGGDIQHLCDMDCAPRLQLFYPDWSLEADIIVTELAD